ncbi:cell division control protein, putative [Entamoeba dispar SAW760]|uniref:Cell division control protein, putative n=1 Tax=Entamoeba dispar (strain ATCC PRA-260 / SAW760) TaxID=370354 RepID=B0ERY5_ENTDS|nr:cell division control protein, putative [Entamoeba dispar SAW760]EDR22780.1 cell division control protein, putative [Entamoeba dispar SAW760]|eukprot:EDR22780.1 cell division control protein, putative [Entamoeba dispar SAW760]
MDQQQNPIKLLIEEKITVPTRENYINQIQKMRKAVMTHDMPTDDQCEKISTRGKVWKILLGIYKIDSFEYCDSGKTDDAKWENIFKDYSRTFRHDDIYEQRKCSDKIVRLLNHVCAAIGSEDVTYLQGMNLIAGMFLAVMPELDSYYCTKKMILQLLPTYYGKNGKYYGVWWGCKLVFDCMKYIDPVLYSHFYSSRSNPIVLMPCFNGLSSNTSPLNEALILWDYYFAKGCFNVVYITLAQLVSCRKILFQVSNPSAILKDFPSLQAKKLILLAESFSQAIPSDLQKLVKQHTISLDLNPFKDWKEITSEEQCFKKFFE